jgi:solute carrier family 10 (sodium/bile acid cotransporter), member 7
MVHHRLTLVSLVLAVLLLDNLNALAVPASSAARGRQRCSSLLPNDVSSPSRILSDHPGSDNFLPLLRGGYSVKNDHQKRGIWGRRHQRQQAVGRGSSSSSSSSSALWAASGGDVDSNSGRRSVISSNKHILSKFGAFCNKNFFLVGMFVAVGMARAFPALGKNGGFLRPELLVGNYGVTYVFLLSGLSLELSQFGKAASNLKLNALIQLVTFVAWPFLVGLPFKHVLSAFAPSAFSPALLDGMLILSCLPTTVNMCVILTSAAGGSTAVAVWNAIISNMGGIFWTPALLFRFFGASIQLPFEDMLLKLSSKVLLPVVIGQALRLTRMKKAYEKHSNTFKRLQEIVLLSIVWNSFCTAISDGFGVSLRDGCTLLAVLPLVHVASLAILFAFFSLPVWKFSRKQVVAALFCASHKTLAFGLPLINTIFEGNANLAAYCAPLMVIFPLQLILGSLLIPRLEKYTEEESEEE